MFRFFSSIPIWALLAIWLLGRMSPGAGDAMDRRQALRLLYYSLPVPSGRFEQLLVTPLIEWIRRQEAALSVGSI